MKDSRVVAGLRTRARLIAAAVYAPLLVAAGCSSDGSSGPSARLHSLSFAVQPTHTGSGAIIGPIEVVVTDARGNRATEFEGDITIVIEGAPTGATLSGTTTRRAARGAATFSDLKIDRIGNYRLTALTSGLSATSSGAFNIVPQLAIVGLPAVAYAEAMLAPVQVVARDAAGQTLQGFNGEVVVALGSGPGSAALHGTRVLTAVNGIATFTDLRVSAPGTGFTLTAFSGTTTVTSPAFTVAVPQYVFTVQPANTLVGVPFPAGVQVAVTDGAGTTLTRFVGSVTLSLDPAMPATMLTGTTTVSVVAGIANFNNVRLGSAGSGITLVAGTGAGAARSSAFDVRAPRLVFSVQPSSADAGLAMPTIQLSVVDPDGNLVPNYPSAISVAVTPHPTGAVLSGTTARVPVNGTASFSDLVLNRAGTGYTLSASAPGAATVLSNPFTIQRPSGSPWEPLAPMPTGRFGLAVAEVGGILYAIGGWTAQGQVVGTVEAYNPVSDTWISRAPMPTPRAELDVGVIDGIIYAVGGRLAGPNMNGAATVEAYDPVTNSWTSRTPMPTAREGMRVGVSNGLLYTIGGTHSYYDGALGTVEVYNPVTNSWSTRSPMPTPRTDFGLAVLDGIMYAMAGTDWNSDTGVVANTEAYNPATDKWIALPAMPTYRWQYAAIGAEGVVFTVGGIGAFNQGALSTVEVFNPATNSWSPRLGLPVPRSALGLGVVGGFLYAIGGRGDLTAVNVYRR